MTDHAQIPRRSAGAAVSEFLQSSSVVLTIIAGLVSVVLWASTHASQKELLRLERELRRHEASEGHPQLVARIQRAEQDLQDIKDNFKPVRGDLRAIRGQLSDLRASVSVVLDRLKRSKDSKKDD